MAYLCVFPGRRGREIADIITDSELLLGWTVIPNQTSEETRRMYVYNVKKNTFNPSDVPISQIRILKEDNACALELLQDKEMRELYVQELLKDDSLKY